VKQTASFRGAAMVAGMWACASAHADLRGFVDSVTPKSDKTPPAAVSPALNPADRQTDAAFNVALGEPPISVARDTTCEKVAATSPSEIAINVLGANDVEGFGKKIFDEMKDLGDLGKGRPADKKLLDNAKIELKRQVWLPLLVEEQIGNNILEKRRAAKVVTFVSESDPSGEEAYANVKPVLQAIVASTAGIQPYHVKLFIYDDEGSQPNAEALPGGIVLVNMALAQSGEPARLSGYLSHELGHVVKRHQTMALQANVIDSTQSVKALRKLVLSKDTQLAAKLMEGINMNGTLFTRYYSSQELEADGCAGKLLASTKESDAKEAIRLFLEDIGQFTKPTTASQETSTGSTTGGAAGKTVPVAGRSAANGKAAGGKTAGGKTAGGQAAGALAVLAANPRPPSEIFMKQHPSYADRKKTLEDSYSRWRASQP
jgi:hypothetical protein